jgi:hypothetical protein
VKAEIDSLARWFNGFHEKTTGWIELKCCVYVIYDPHNVLRMIIVMNDDE